MEYNQLFLLLVGGDVGNDFNHTAQELLGEGDMQEFVGSVSIGLGSQDTSNDEFSLRISGSEEVDERNGATFTVVQSVFSEEMLRSSVDNLIEPLFTGRRVPATGTSSLKDGDFSTIRRVFSDSLLDEFNSLSGIKSRGKSHGDSERGFRSQDVTSSGSGGKAIDTSNNNSRSPDSVQIAFEFRVINGLSSGNPREFANQLFSDDTDDFFSFSVTVFRDDDLEVLNDFTSFGVFKSSKELSKDSESIRDNTGSITRVNTFFNNLDLNIKSSHSSKSVGDPELIVVTATRVHTDKDGRSSDSAAELIEIVRKIDRATFFITFNEDNASGVSKTEFLDSLDGHNTVVDSITIISTTSTV